MKKFIFWIILFLSFTFSVKAGGVSNYRMDITVLENGSIYVVEALEMKDPYNGFERNINYKNNFTNYYGNLLSLTKDGNIYNGSGVTLGEIRGINFDLQTPLFELQINGDLFNRVTSAYKGDYKTYLVNKNDDGEAYVIYNHSKMNKDILLSYTLENIIITHKDVAELVFNLFTNLKEDIEHLEITLHLPTSSLKPKLFLHNIEGTIDVIDNQTINITIDNIKRDSNVDFRLLFDKDTINNKKTSNILAIKEIFEVEEKLKQQNEYIDQDYNKLRQEAYDLTENALKTNNKEDYLKSYDAVKNLNENDELKIELLVKLVNLESKIERNESMYQVLFTSIIVAWILGLVIIILYYFQKYFTNERVLLKEKYDPLVLNYLFNRKITDDGLVAAILYLINNKVITYVKNEEDFTLKLNKIPKLKESDLRLVKLLFNDKKKVTYQELQNRSKIDYRNFIRLYSNWLNSASLEVREEPLFESLTFIKIFNIIYGIIGVFLGVFLFKHDTYFSSIYMIILAFILIIINLLIYKRNKLGISIYGKYSNLKKAYENIIDLENIDENLICSVSLGNFDYVVKQLKNKDISNLNIYIDIKKAIYNIIKGAYSSRNFDNK